MTDTYVFNIGFNRSGTTSLTDALNILGIPSLHFSVDNSGWSKNRSKEIEFLISQNKSNGHKLLHTLDHIYQGFCDFNGEHYYKTLYEQYPNSRFILTIRPPEDWIRSLITLERRQKRIPKIHKKEHKYFRSKIDHYFKKTAEIRDFFKDKPYRLLEMDICNGDSWPVLCKFLGKEIPQVPFPFENKTEK